MYKKVSLAKPWSNFIFKYASLVWYHKLTGQWKDEIQKIQNTRLRKILGAFRFAPIKAMQYNAKILPVSIRMKEIRDRFAIRAIRAVSPKTLCGNSQTAVS